MGSMLAGGAATPPQGRRPSGGAPVPAGAGCPVWLLLVALGGCHLDEGYLSSIAVWELLRRDLPSGQVGQGESAGGQQGRASSAGTVDGKCQNWLPQTTQLG